jgi:hypothetical protein
MMGSASTGVGTYIFFQWDRDVRESIGLPIVARVYRCCVVKPFAGQLVVHNPISTVHDETRAPR